MMEGLTRIVNVLWLLLKAGLLLFGLIITIATLINLLRRLKEFFDD